jgi:hypothetical protein
VRRGRVALEEVMPSSTAPSYRPIEAESGGLFTLLRAIAPLILIAIVVLSFFPEALRGLPEGWRVPSAHLRIFAVAAFLALIANNARALAKRNRARRAALEGFAASVGGRRSEAPYRVTPTGWEGGPRVEYQASGRPVVLSIDRGSRSSHSCRLSAELPLARDFQFQIVPGGRAMRFILSKSFILPVLKVAARTGDPGVRVPGLEGAPSRGALQERILHRIRYLADDPVPSGDDEFDRRFLVKASDASLGRSLVSDPSVRSALTALRERAPGFQLGLENMAGEGPARLVGGITPFDFSAETLAAVDGAMRAVLDVLGRLDLLQRDGRGAA